MSQLPPPGWYPKPDNPADGMRWWDGQSWTQHTHPPLLAASARTMAPSQSFLPDYGFQTPYQETQVQLHGKKFGWFYNKLTYVALIVSAVYILIDLSSSSVFVLGIAPLVTTVRAVSRKEPLAPLAVLAVVVVAIMTFARFKGAT